jgi:hypothetical protein
MTADEPILVQKILSNLGKPQKPLPLLCDNTAAGFTEESNREPQKKVYGCALA